jgi:hypothetical protein
MDVHTVREAVIWLNRHLKLRSSTKKGTPFIRGSIGLTFRGFFPRQSDKKSENFSSFLLSCNINIYAPVHNNLPQIILHVLVFLYHELHFNINFI